MNETKKGGFAKPPKVDSSIEVEGSNIASSESKEGRLHFKNIDHKEISEDSVSKPLSIAEILNKSEFDHLKTKRSMK